MACDFDHVLAKDLFGGKLRGQGQRLNTSTTCIVAFKERKRVLIYFGTSGYDHVFLVILVPILIFFFYHSMIVIISNSFCCAHWNSVRNNNPNTKMIGLLHKFIKRNSLQIFFEFYEKNISKIFMLHTRRKSIRSKEEEKKTKMKVV